MTILKSNTGSANSCPTLPVGVLLREVLQNRNTGNPFGRWVTSSAIGANLSSPPMDFYEDPAGYTVRVDVPGLSREEIDISYQEGVLTISGKRTSGNQESEQPTKNYYIRERGCADFSRSLDIPSVVKVSDIKATVKDGILTVELPKAEEAKPQKIAVSVA
jgi:HSP20 family protein